MSLVPLKKILLSWAAIDIGRGRRLIPSQYCLRHGAAAAAGNALRCWDIRAKTHHSGPWVTIDSHTNDTTLGNHIADTHYYLYTLLYYILHIDIIPYFNLTGSPFLLPLP